MEKQRIYVETYGCQMNVYDSELMQGILQERSEFTEDPSRADVVLVNTCAIRENAEQRVLQRLHHFARQKKSNPRLVVGVTGCMARHISKQLQQRYPFLDLVLGPDSYRKLPELIDRVRQEGSRTVVDTAHNRLENYDYIFPRRNPGVNAWVAIGRGCDHFCTYCVVPYTRGRERSRSPESILAEVRKLAAEGFPEVTLLGQNVNSYRADGLRFPDLLEKVSEVPGIKRIRFTSPHPVDFSARLLAVIQENPKVMNHTHLPLQSGSSRVLELMGREYNAEQFVELALRAREKVDDLGLSTDIIVGFPTETEEDFQQTLEVVRTVGFDSAFTFKYSERPGTRAARELPDDVPDAVKTERLNRLLALQREISRERNARCIGKSFWVLVEGPSPKTPQEWTGRTGSNRVTVFPYRGGMVPGDLVRIRVEEVSGFTLRGTLI